MLTGRALPRDTRIAQRMGFWCVPVQNENKSKRGLRHPKEVSALGQKRT